MVRDTKRYGSLYEDLVDFVFRSVNLSCNDHFLDIGSGIGQIVMQAAAWAGCHSTVRLINTIIVVG